MAKFLLVTHIFPPAIDGGSKVISKMGDYLEKHGHQVMVLTTNCRSTDDFTSPRRSKKIPSEDGQNIYRLPVITLFHRPFKFLGRLFPNFRTFSKGPIFSPLSCISFLVSCLKFRPDFILTGPLPTTMVLYARLIRFLTKVLKHQSTKVLINASFHSTDLDFQTPILINTLKSADYIWTLTENETNYFHKHLNIPRSKLILLGNGIDQNFLKIPPSSRGNKRGFDLLFIGSFAAHKDLPTLIKAFSELPPNFTLTLAGQKTLYFPQIETQIKLLPPSIKKRIDIIFDFNNNYLSTLLDNCSLLISPSTQESFGLVLIEAMARGRAVIAADIPASRELITKSRGGLTFITGDAIDLKNKILKLSSSPKLLHSLSRNGFDYVKNNSTWDRIGNQLCQKLHI